jgi:hypothetical protein
MVSLMSFWRSDTRAVEGTMGSAISPEMQMVSVWKVFVNVHLHSTFEALVEMCETVIR